MVHISYMWSKKKKKWLLRKCKKKEERVREVGTTSYIIGELQIKIIRYHYTSIRIAKI